VITAVFPQARAAAMTTLAERIAASFGTGAGGK
jgi:hypothetical protein